LKVAFFGTPAFAVPTLDALVEAGHEIVTVVAQPDRPSGRGQKLQAPPTVVWARALGIETRQPRGLRTGPFPERFCALDLDVAVVVAYGRILPEAVLAAPRLGSVNGHASLLPRWRGAAPIERAILAGDATTGVTTMQMDAGLDTGDMLLARETAIGPEETAPELRARLAGITAALLMETLAGLEGVAGVPQPVAGITYAAPLEKAEGRMNWSRSAGDLHNQVRALQPWPGTVCELRGEPLKIRRVRVAEGQGAPGEVLQTRKAWVVACGEGALEVREAQLPNKKSLPGDVLANGARIELGEVLS
jgi:methionyl-tRNA formyltransferase